MSSNRSWPLPALGGEMPRPGISQASPHCNHDFKRAYCKTAPRNRVKEGVESALCSVPASSLRIEEDGPSHWISTCCQHRTISDDMQMSMDEH